MEATARDALAEMRRLFGVLRGNGEAVSLKLQPGLGDLGRLLHHVRGSGLEVTERIEGQRYDLPPGVDLAAYRILQEALTNALRHSEATRATVVVGYGETCLEVVADARPGSGS